METRKVQQVGGGTYTVSVLKEWAEEYDVEAGDTLYLSAHLDGSLVVRCVEETQSDLEAVRIRLDRPSATFAERLLKAGYVVGFRRLTLVTPETFTDEQRRSIHRTVRDLNGVEVVEESDGEITAQAVLDVSDISIRQSVLQLRFVTLSMLEESMDALVGASDGARHVRKRDDEVDRLCELVTRHFHRSLIDFREVDQLGVDRPQLFHYYRTARNFERIADHAVTIAKAAEGVETPLSESVTDEIEALRADVRQVVEVASDAAVNGRSPEDAHDALDARDRIVERSTAATTALSERSPEEASLVTRVLDSLVQIARCGGNVAEVALQGRVRFENCETARGLSPEGLD